VRRLAAAGRTGSDLTPELLDEVAGDRLDALPSIDAAVLTRALDPAAVVATRVAVGGAAAEPLDAMLDEISAGAEGLAGSARRRLDAMDEAESALLADARRLVEEVHRA
jgi:argininosuccinate lyase